MTNLLLSYFGIGLNTMPTPKYSERVEKPTGRTKAHQKRRSRKSISNKSKRANRR